MCDNLGYPNSFEFFGNQLRSKPLWLGYLCFLGFVGACSPSIQKSSARQDVCKQALMAVEKKLFYSVPISKSPADVISYLDQLEGFARNREYDFGNGSVRFNAKNAKYGNSNLIDEKSLFLINYTIDQMKNPDFIIFQAIYYFETEEEKEKHFNEMLEVLNKELQLKEEVRYDLLNNLYARYYLPCKTAINLSNA
jgi:hypothetical protein